MTFILPPQGSKRHQQLNKNDLSGTIYQSRNINLDEEGYIKLADASVALYTEDNDANFDVADAMFPMESSIYINSDELFTGSTSFSNLQSRALDTNSPSPSVEDDVVFFNNVPCVSDGTLFKYEGTSGVWTTVTPGGFSASYPIAMCVWGAENNLAIGNGNIVKFVNTSFAVSATILTLPAEYQVSSMASKGSQLYIATRSRSGGEAMIFTANGIATSADTMHSCGTFELPTIKTYKSSIVGLTTLGQLVQFTGGGFTEIASLPIYATQLEWADALNDYSTIANRGMAVDGDLIYININTLIENQGYKLLPGFHAGVWCYDDTNKSLYHKYSATYSRSRTISGTVTTVSAANNTFTLTSGNLNDSITGMPVFYNDGSGTKIPELKNSVCYFLIKDSSTVFKLATTYTNALAGTPIDITGAGNFGQDFYIIRVNDYGFAVDDSRKSVAVLNSRTTDSTYFGRIAFTADLFSKQVASTNRAVFCGVSPYLPNRGYFITPKLESQNIEDTFQKLYIKHKPLKTDDKIIVKYKSKETSNFPFASVKEANTSTWSATWTDTDTFTTTVDLSEVVAGDEIELIAGVGSGHIAHVLSISVNAGTYTVNLTEAFPFAVANDIFYFMVDKWTLLETITSTNPTNLDGYLEIGLSDKDGLAINSKFIQFKVEMRGVGVTISELQVSNQSNKYTSVYN
jgi:hypothetical protein